MDIIKISKSKYWTIKLFLLFLILCQFSSGCKQEQKQQPSITSDGNSIDKVQAVLKVQSDPYDYENNSKITSEYVQTSDLSVPKSLLPQSKWIMFEGPVLENDKIAYRYYADARHRFDIYGKKVSDLVMDTVSWDYHNIMDWGSDILKVGNSLGIGSPAILHQDSIYAFEEWEAKNIEIIKDTDTESVVRTTFTGLKIGNELLNIQQDWSLKAGEYFSTITLQRTDGDLPADMSFATGIVSHLSNVKSYNEAGMYYSYTWGEQSFHKQKLGMAIIANEKYQPEKYENPLTHITVFKTGSKEVKYHFMAVWADGVGNIETENSFKEELMKINNN